MFKAKFMVNKEWAGIDYGSKMAGTTVIAAPNEQRKIQFFQSEKKKDADRFIMEWVGGQEIPPPLFLDAPLSLPIVYRNSDGGSDYFYREADKAVKAMSPMFLGGLTARAMKLSHHLSTLGCTVYEVYPGHLARTWELNAHGYKKQKDYLPAVLEAIQPHLPLPLAQTPENWHQIDALLAFLSGYRFFQNTHQTFGSVTEGCIFV